ncbi:MAG: alpha/beta hydrolase [Saprospiraceae bacterium]|nr:alpha/beta hydrolase [Saprospiraceae bacterium]
MRCLIIIFIFLSFPLFIMGQTYIDFLNKGNYDIGYRSVIYKDYTRPYHHAMAQVELGVFNFRPVQVNIWYPARLGKDASKMKVSEYIAVRSDFEKKLSSWISEEKQQVINTYKENLIAGGLVKEKAEEIINASTNCTLDAKALEDAFPLIIFSPSMLGHSVSNTKLCEFLASHGYIVAATTSHGISRTQMTTDITDLETQAKDIELVINRLLESDFNINKIGLLGHSWGGMAAILVASRNINVSAVASLDGSEEVWQDLLFNAPHFEVTNFQTPYLRLSRQESFGFFPTLEYADKVFIKFPEDDIQHFDFVSGITLDASKERFYNVVCNIVLDFFDAYLNPASKPTIQSITSPLLQKYNKQTSKIETSAAIKDFPTESELVNLIISGKIDNVIQLIQTEKSRNSNLLTERYLIRIGELLLWSGKNPKESEAIFKLVLQYYPQSALAYEMLGHIYSWLYQNNEKALEYYRIGNKIDPNNMHIIENMNSIKK